MVRIWRPSALTAYSYSPASLRKDFGFADLRPNDMALLQRNKHMKSAIATPTVMREIAIESKNIARVELICHVDEAGVGEICGGVAVFMEDFLDVTCAAES